MSVSIFGMPQVTPSAVTRTAQFTELPDLGLRVPADAFAAVADLVHQRAERGEALEDVRVVAFDDLHVGRGLAGDQVALAALPVLDLERLRQLRRAVVHQWCQHQLALDTEVPDADLAELLRDEPLNDLPVAACDSQAGSWAGVDSGCRNECKSLVQVTSCFSYQVCGRQHDVGVVGTTSAHAQVERCTIRSSLPSPAPRRAHSRLSLTIASLARSGRLPSTLLMGAEHVLEEMSSWPLPHAGADQVASIDPHAPVARPVLRVHPTLVQRELELAAP